MTLYDATLEKGSKTVAFVGRVAATKEGRFAFRAPPPSGYRLVVALPAGGRLESGVVELDAGRRVAVTDWLAR